MLRVSAMFVAACMILIAVSFGAVLHLTLGLPLTGAVLCAVAALTGLVLCTIAASSWRERTSSDQVANLSRGIADLARQVTELGRRVAGMESKVADALARAQSATAPLSAEIGEIGEIVKELAEAVSAHEIALQEAATLPPYPAEPQPPAAEAARTAMPALLSPAGNAKVQKWMEADAEPGGTMRPVAVTVPEPSRSGAGFKSLAPAAAGTAIRDAVEANRVEFHLQPIVSLPQRKVRHYEALARLRMADGELVPAGDFLDLAEAAGLMPRIDNLMVFRCVKVVRRLISKNRDIGLFCNISASTLADAEFFPQFTEFMAANRAIAAALVFELTQAAYRSLGPIESESLAALMGWGFRFSLDHVSDLKFEPRDLADRGFRFIKAPASLLLGQHPGGAADIHAADLSGLMSRFGIELVVEKVESEGAVLDLLDHDIKYGQGYLFSRPRPVRTEVLAALPERPLPASASERRAAAEPPSAVAADTLPEPPQRATGLAKIARTVTARAAP
jgi:cyclic-di-GMP phosphodiesterase, flagellum assembly factor TipF